MKRFRNGQRVQGAKEHSQVFFSFHNKAGIIITTARAKTGDNDRHQVLFDDTKDRKHAYWFNRDELKEEETDESL